MQQLQCTYCMQKCAISDLMVNHVTHYLHCDCPQVTRSAIIINEVHNNQLFKLTHMQACLRVPGPPNFGLSLQRGGVQKSNMYFFGFRSFVYII